MIIAKRTPSEHVEQREFVKWFRQNYPDVKIFAIPNGEKRSPSVAARLKVEGVLKGVPDLFIPEWKMWIEMKRVSGGKTSKEQKELIDYLKSVGYECFVAKGCEEAINIVLTRCE